MTALRILAGSGIYYLPAESERGRIRETNEEALPYLEKTLKKIKEKLGITEIQKEYTHNSHCAIC
jgi:hypothetical protein